MLRVKEVIIVEGRYDAAHLANLVDGLIITTNGFSIYTDKEKRELIKTLGAQRGLLILTDSDHAGFQIRNYISQFAQNVPIKHVYIPQITGKEARKAAPSKEGFLGVEGVDAPLLISAIEAACTKEPARDSTQEITYTDLFRLGLSGKTGAASVRQQFLKSIGLPAHLSKKALIEVVNRLYSREEFTELAEAFMHSNAEK